MTTSPAQVCTAQTSMVWRDGASQVRLARFLQSVAVLPFGNGFEVGRLLARAGTRDVVDAQLVVAAMQRSAPILTGDVDDLEMLTAALPERRPAVLAWP